MSEAALLVANALKTSVETTLNPRAPQADRHGAYIFIEEFKEGSPLCSEVGALLAKTPGLPVIRSFGLQLLEHSVRFRWNTISLEEKYFIKESVMELLNAHEPFGGEAVYVKEGIARIVVEMAKREWPQHWALFLEEIFGDCLQNQWKCELSLIILLRLSEDIGVLENVENPKRRRDLFQQFTASLPQILEFLDSVLTHYFSLLSVEGRTGSDKSSETRVIQAALKVISCAFEWCPVAIIGEDERGIFRKLLPFMHEPRFRILAAECYTSIISRRDLHSEVLMKFFERNFLEAIFSSASSECYEFEKKSAEVFVSLGGLLLYVGGKTPNFRFPESSDVYFRVLVNLVDNDSLVIREGALAQLNSLLRTVSSRLSPIVDFVLPLLVPILIKRLPKIGYPFRNDHPACKLSLSDFASDDDFSQVFLRFQSCNVGLLKFATPLCPDICFREAMNFLNETISKVMLHLTSNVDPKSELCARLYAAAHAVDSVLESLFKNQKLELHQVSEGQEILMTLIQIRPNDLRLIDLILSCVSALIYCCKSSDEVKVVLNYCVGILESNSKEFSDFAKPRADLRRHAGSVLVKMAKTLSDLMSPLITDVITLAKRLSDKDKFSSVDLGIVKSVALILINDLQKDEIKAQYVLETMQPLPEQWFELPVQGPVEFLQFYGCTSSVFDSSEFVERRLQLSNFLNVIHLVLSHIRPCNGKNVAFPIISDLLPNIFRVAKVLTEIYAWSKHAPKELAPGFQLAKGEKVGLLTQGISHSTEGIHPIAAPSPDDPLVTAILKYIPVIYQYICDIIANLGFALGEEVYRIQGLKEAVAHSLLSELGLIPEFRQRMVVKAVCRLVEHCPPAFYEHFAVPLIGEVLSRVADQLNSRWIEIMSKVQTEEREEEENDVLAESITRDLGKELLELVKTVYTGSRNGQERGQPNTNNENEVIDEEMGERNGASSNSQISTISDLAKAVLITDGVAQNFLAIQARSLSWPDTNSCMKSVNTLIKTLEFLLVHLPGGDIGSDLATSILINGLHGLEVNGQHDGNRDALLSLISKLFSSCSRTYPALFEILGAIPQTDGGNFLSQFHKLMGDSTAPNVPAARLEKQKKDILRKVVEPIIGKHSGQLYKREVHMKTLPSLQIKPRKIRPPSPEVAEIGLAGLFDEK